jgi:hypothetical protein
VQINQLIMAEQAANMSDISFYRGITVLNSKFKLQLFIGVHIKHLERHCRPLLFEYHDGGIVRIVTPSDHHGKVVTNRLLGMVCKAVSVTIQGNVKWSTLQDIAPLVEAWIIRAFT